MAGQPKKNSSRDPQALKIYIYTNIYFLCFKCVVSHQPFNETNFFRFSLSPPPPPSLSPENATFHDIRLVRNTYLEQSSLTPCHHCASPRGLLRRNPSRRRDRKRRAAHRSRGIESTPRRTPSDLGLSAVPPTLRRLRRRFIAKQQPAWRKFSRRPLSRRRAAKCCSN